MNRIALLALAITVCTGASAHGQIADFTFDNATAVSTANSPLATVSDLSSPLANMFAGGNWCTTSVWASSSPQGPFNNSDSYVEFTVTPSGVCDLQLDELVLDTWRGGGLSDVIEFAGVYADEDPGPGGDNFQTLIASGDIYPQSSGSDRVTFDLSGAAHLRMLSQPTTIRIYLWGDANSGSSNAEIDRIKLRGDCAPGLLCELGFATEVMDAMQGSQASSSNSDPNATLAGDMNTRFSLGANGFVTVGFGRSFSNSGSSTPDIEINEYNAVDCYTVSLRPANQTTADAMIAAGLVIGPDGFITLADTYCSDQRIDLDALFPGLPERALVFTELRINDDGSSGDGAEIEAIAAFSCNVGLIGDRVWMDANCDGIQGALEMGLAGVSVRLIAADGMTQLDQTVTGPDGRYSFEVAPGTYFIEVGYDANRIMPTLHMVGSDRAADSNIDPATNRSEPIMVGPNADISDIDAGFCAVCVGVSATVNANLGACGLAIDPVLSSTDPVIGSILELGIASPLPSAQVFVFGRLAPPQRTAFFTGTTTCEVWIDPAHFMLFFTGVTDANGDWTLMVPLPADPAFVGVDVTLQARVCSPGNPGPIPGFPDWLTNGVHLTFGCP